MHSYELYSKTCKVLDSLLLTMYIRYNLNDPSASWISTSIIDDKKFVFLMSNGKIKVNDVEIISIHSYNNAGSGFSSKIKEESIIKLAKSRAYYLYNEIPKKIIPSIKKWMKLDEAEFFQMQLIYSPIQLQAEIYFSELQKYFDSDSLTFYFKKLETLTQEAFDID